MATILNVIALVSGGKDSYFSMLHSIAQGHRIIALANLHPPLQRTSVPTLERLSDLDLGSPEDLSSEYELDDMDSFMYQTAGHTLVPSQAQALELPLYRRAIDGIAVDTSRHYRIKPHTHVRLGRDEQEETECLTTLLTEIIHAHSEVNAVCSGAILSTYQRTRIESVAVRLGLIPLSFLWQYPVLPGSSGAKLLDDMSNIGFDVRFVKVASGGLDQSLLWSDLMTKSVRSRLERVMGRYGGNVLGEGGEYETLVLRGPSPIWKNSLSIDESQIQTRTDAGGTSSLSFSPQSITSSPISTEDAQAWLSRLRKIPLWDDTFLKVKEYVAKSVHQEISDSPISVKHQEHASRNDATWSLRVSKHYVGPFLNIFNLCPSDTRDDASQQMASLNDKIIAHLMAVGRHTEDIVFTTIILRSISRDYAVVNSVYSKLFDTPNPPARVTIASELPQGVDVVLSIVVNFGSQEARSGLHVQSQSYWAPANIGPYSQAIRVTIDDDMSIVYVAGQIPLVPASMTPLSDSSRTNDHKVSRLRFLDDTCLSLQHMWRIGKEMEVAWWAGTIVFIPSSNDTFAKAHLIFHVWSRVHDANIWASDIENEEALDPWDTKYGNKKLLGKISAEPTKLPDFDRIASGTTQPGIFVVEVAELPRTCEVEWQGLGTAQASMTFELSRIAGFDALTCFIGGSDHLVVFVSIPWPEDPCDLLIDMIAKIPRDRDSSVTIYTNGYKTLADCEAQVIPCKSVWRPSILGTESLAAGLVLHSCVKQGDRS